MDQLDTWASFSTVGFLIVMIVHLFYRKKSLRLTNWRQFFDGTAQLTDPKPVSTTIRIVCGAMSLSVLAYGLFLTAKIIETYVWEGPVPLMDVFVIYPLIWFALWMLVRVGQDYRQAVYGRPSRQIDPEQLGQMRESLLDGDPIKAIRVYRKPFSDVGLEEAKRFVDQLALKVEGEDPERYAANQRKFSQINWRAAGICLVIETIVVLAIWSMMGPLHPGLIATGLIGGLLFGGAIIHGTQFKKNLRRRRVILCIAVCGIVISFLATVMFTDPNASHSPLGWPWIAGFLSGVFLVFSAYTRRRRVRGQ